MSFTQILIGLLLKPRETITNLEPVAWEVYLIVGVTMIARALQKSVDIPILFQNFKLAGLFNAFNGLAGLVFTWFAITFYLHFTAYQLGSEGKFSHLLSLMGYALFPFLLTIVASTLIHFLGQIIFPNLGVFTIEVIQLSIEEGGPNLRLHRRGHRGREPSG